MTMWNIGCHKKGRLFSSGETNCQWFWQGELFSEFCGIFWLKGKILRFVIQICMYWFHVIFRVWMQLKRIGVKLWLSMLPVLVIWLRLVTKKWKKLANLKIVPFSMWAAFLHIKLSLLGINFSRVPICFIKIHFLFHLGGLMLPQKVQ